MSQTTSKSAHTNSLSSNRGMLSEGMFTKQWLWVTLLFLKKQKKKIFLSFPYLPFTCMSAHVDDTSAKWYVLDFSLSILE
jgi:hypothetical protein